MKTHSFIKVLFLLLLSIGSLQAQDVIYSEDFNDDVGQGNDGGVIELSEVEWTLNTDACTIVAGDYVKVVDTGNTRLEALNCNGEAIWMSPMIDISAYEDVNISIYVKELGTSTSTSKFVKLYYKTSIDGEEILFPINGLNDGNFDESTASVNNINGNQIFIIAKLNSHLSTNRVYIDDILVSGIPIVISNDALTQVLEPTSQVSPQNISSIANDINSAEALLRFKLTEPSGADDLGTKIASIKFTNIASDNSADLANQFGGFAIHDGSNFIPTSSVNISVDEVILSFLEDDFTLSDDSSHEYELRAYLKLSGITDGKKVKLEIAAGATSITTYNSGSDFDNANSEVVVSPEHLISVIGTNLRFTAIPTISLIKNTSFSLSLDARDINGNIDLDVNQNIDLSLETGTGILGGVLANNLSSGQVTFNDLSYNQAENIIIQASATGFVSAISEPISIISSQSTDLSLPVWIPSNLKISSLKNSEEDAFEVFKFSVEDKGDDLESTFLNALRLVPGDNNSMNWQDKIAGFILHMGANKLDASCTFDNSALNISIADTESLREITEGTSRDYSISAYLKTEQADGQILQLKIENTHEGWGTSGSGLVPNLIGDLLGPSFSIDIAGTHLHFISIPTFDVGFASNFQLGAELTDVNGNKDSDASQNVNLAVVDGNGVLSGTLTKSLISGSVVFNDLSYNYSELITLSISSDGLIGEESEEINILSSKSTHVQVIDWLPDNLNISSLAVSENDYTEVFRFQINDIGDDKEPTRLKKIRLISSVNNTLNWEEGIADFRLKINGEVVDAEFLKTEKDLIISFQESENLASIVDGTSSELSLSIYLNEKSTDGARFQASIEKGHSVWEVNGTQLIEEFTSDLSGPSFTIDVYGTELIFTNKPPKIIVPNESFEMGLKVLDKYGNQDLSSAVVARASLASGTGELSSVSGLNTGLVEGEFLWNDLIYNAAENFTLIVEADGMSPVLSDNISSLDVNSLVIPSNSPIQSKALNPMATSSDNSEVIFKFLIKDLGTSDDDPTIINTMKFYNKLSGEGLGWKKHLAGCTLIKDGEVIAKTMTIEDDFISFTSLDVEVVNASQSEFELGVFFKKSLLPDKAQIQVEIRKKHGWKASTTASSLETEFSENIQSALHYIEINADRLSFVSCPIGITSDDTFDLIIAAVDEYQNIDIDKTSLLKLSLTSGDGSLSQEGSIGHLANGILEVADLTYSGNQMFELSANGDLTTATKAIFVQEESLILFDDFESQSLSEWQNTSDWASSSYLSINGSYSLKHNLTNAIGNSFIARPLDNIHIGSESIYWEFILKNSAWDPTSSNKFVFHLLMDFNDPDLANNLYSVGVNLSGSDDKLSLWKTNDEGLELLIKSDFDWNEDESVAVKVEYTAKGEWRFDYNRLGEKNNWLGAGMAFSEVEGDVETWYSGLEFNFETASRAGELWFDDINIESYNTAPFLKTYAVFSDSIVLNFSENLSLLESSKLNNFQLELEDNLIPIKEIKAGSLNDQLILFMEIAFLTGQYHLSLSGLVDLNGAISQTEEIEFEFFAESKAHDLIINEIFADETPVVGLPEYEFIEIYNASHYPINIKDYKLKVGSTEKILSDFEIQSHEYLILCSNAAVELYKAFGNSLGLSSFPSLTNSGVRISLESLSGVLLDQVTYSSDWYADEEKKDGGWSLERIDASNFCSTVSNWSASENEKGGTPGHVNSVKGVYKDIVAPELTTYFLLSNQELQLEFSESINEDVALLLSNYAIVG
ncbi:lamin tail domain-containing protein, partial [Ancylomarina euxinus]|uniref:lamin tail domain-containing protein n=1 Tax=Ancylomarina euxinus TaxID=2283627 RepID=UPI0012E30D79